ncbi:MAG: hypothetical protein HFI09_03460 [Bacilli bacterium]|nr:hypothetical protein [Bacilli bacterium]
MLKKYKIALTFIVILVACTIGIGIGYIYFEKIEPNEDHATVFVDGDLSFNFINGQTIDTSLTNQYTFSITNTSSISYYYNLALENIQTEDGINFELQSDREGFQTISKKLTNGSYTYSGTIKINGNETHSYTFIIDNPEKKKIDGKLTVEIEKDMNTFANVILKNNIINEKAITALGEIATEEEGLIESTDDSGTSYYFRGSAKNNYVTFADLTWRIVKINGDGTIKLILNDLINNNTQFYKEQFDLVFETSNIYQELTSWYNSTLNNFDHLIANYRFCTDATNGETGYSSITRIYTNKDPIFQCLGTTNTAKIGLLTADELSFAGANNKGSNENFYLYNENIKSGWWTMSPAKNNDGAISYIEIQKNGQLNSGTNGVLFRGVRPVINIIKKATVSGTGSLDNPYVVNTQ